MKNLISAFWAAAALTATAAAEPSFWRRPQTTHYYLQGPKAERLIVCWREGKVTVGEVRHEHDWQKTFYYREETTPEAFGVRPSRVLGDVRTLQSFSVDVLRDRGFDIALESPRTSALVRIFRKDTFEELKVEETENEGN